MPSAERATLATGYERKRTVSVCAGFEACKARRFAFFTLELDLGEFERDQERHQVVLILLGQVAQIHGKDVKS